LEHAGPVVDSITGETLVSAPRMELALVRKSRVMVRCLDNDTGESVMGTRVLVGILIPEDTTVGIFPPGTVDTTEGIFPAWYR
jgi:hypothetical protein